MPSKRARQQRAQDGGRPQGGLISDLLAREIRTALLSPPQTVKPPAHPRGAQWRCETCLKLNDVGRKICRLCQHPAPTRPSPSQKLPPDQRRPPLGHDQRKNLGKPSWKDVVTAARQAGASEDTVQALEKDAAAAQAKAESSPAQCPTNGDRLHQAEGKARKAAETLKKANARVASLEQQLADARAKAAEAEDHQDIANKELEEARFVSVGQPGTMLDGVRSLLQVLHGQPNAPSEVKAAASVLRALVPEATLDERVVGPLESEVTRRFSRFATKRQTCVDQANDNEDASVCSSAEDDLPAMDESRGLKRTAPATPPRDSAASEFDDLSLAELEERLAICQQEYGQALEAKSYSNANALSGVMYKMVQALDRKSGGLG